MKQLLVRLALVYGSVLLWTRILRPDYLHPALLVYLLLACLAGGLKEPYRRWAQVLLLGGGALSCLVFLLVIPYSVYLVWFELLAQGAARGTVSWTILTLAGYLSLLACFDLRPKNNLKPVLLYGLVQTTLLFILFQASTWATLGILLFILYLLADFLPRGRPSGFHWAAVTGTGITVLALIFAALPIHDPDPAGKRLIDHHVSRQLRFGLGRYVPGFPLLYGVSGHWLGHGFSNVELGGRVSLSSRPVFSVEGRAGDYHYLRTQVFNQYINNSWQLGPRIDDQAGRPGIMYGEPDQDAEVIRITILDDFYNILPHTLESETIILPRPVQNADFSGSFATGISLRHALLYGETMFLQMADREESRRPDGDLPYQRFPGDHYLQLPATLYRGIHELAGTLSAASAADFMDSLSTALSEGFSYTLTPRNDEGGDNFLENFLFRSREGYCVHFATAAVILARLKGIPARYVTGYLVHIPDVDDESFLPVPTALHQGIASGLNSHAWAELWFPETGWLMYEATPAFRLLVAGRQDTRSTVIQTDEYSLRQLSAISGRQLDTPVDNRPRPLTTLIIPVLLLLMMIALVLLGMRRRVQMPRPLPAGRQLPVRFVRLGRRILAQTDRLGIPGPELTGWLRWERQLGTLLGTAALPWPPKLDCSLFRAVIFGSRKLDKADYTTLEYLYGCLKKIRKDSGYPAFSPEAP
jgi:transglutaminase-like putative cysteine protease